MRFGGAAPILARRRAGIAVAVLLTVSVLAPGLGWAQQPDGPRNFVSLYFENDTFLDTDQSYTNGVRVSWAGRLSIEEDPWYLPTGRLASWFWRDCDVDPTLCYEWWAGWVAGQSMYTPQDIRDPEIIPDDRPYGGWLYAGPTFTAARPRQGELRAVEHSLQLMLGVLGSPSFAQEAQTFVHEYIATSAPEPMGWDHQVATEPTVNLLYSGRQRQLEHHRNDGAVRVFDLVSEWGFAAGNVFSYVSGGATARLGWNLGEDFGAARVEPVIAMARREHRWEAYLFGRLVSRYTLHNAFLDGGWFRSSVQTVSREPMGADVELGATVRIPRVALSARWVRRTPEFDERRIFQEYASLSLTWFH